MRIDKQISSLALWVLVATTLGALACAPSKRFPWRLEGPGAAVSPSEVQTVNPGYDRVKSKVLVRRVARATRANLDYAAYVANVMLNQPRDERIATLEGSFIPPQPLGGVVVPESLCASLDQTPLSAQERARPLAFVPLVDYLARWNADKSAGLERARSTVREETWGLAQLPGLYLQQITVAYLHRGKVGPEIWVEIEFQRWAKLFEDMPDADGDGYPSIFGKLDDKLITAEIVAQVERDYAGRILAAGEVRRWANELASYWYPSYNTDVVDMGQVEKWPLGATEVPVVQELAGLSVTRPAAVIRGKPHGEAIYNVFAVSGGGAPAAAAGGHKAVASYAALKQVPVAADTAGPAKVIERELEQRGGSWDGWAAAMVPRHQRIRQQLKRRPKKLQGLIGSGGFLFYRKSLDYVVGGDIQRQKPGKNPFATIVAFKDYLKRLNVDFLLVPVPTKSEVFADKLRLPAIKQAGALNPYGRKFIKELLAAGVEVVDLLPAYGAARTKRAKGEEPLYQPQDTHWTDRGLRLAAELIGKRIKRYGWYSALAQQSVEYSLKRVTFKQFGDLHSRIAAGEQRRYRPAKLVGHQVITPEGKPYDDVPSSPIVVLGDSFTGVYQRTYCEHAGVSAHIAHQIGFPVDLVMSYGGGPNVRKKLLTRGETDLKGKRLLIWVFAARDFYNYWEDWEPLAADAK